jgi:hypothetical protein
MLTNRYHGERLGACTDCRRYWGKFRAEEISQDEIDFLKELQKNTQRIIFLQTKIDIACRDTPGLLARLARRVRQLSPEVERDFTGREMVVVSLLNGTVMFLADLIRHLDMPLRVGLLQTRSYRGPATRPDEWAEVCR